MSCDTPLSAVSGHRVETAESLDEGDNPHPLLTALLEAQAGQCGYCLPGILMTAKALLDENPVRTRAEIAEALDGNLCRCGAHTRILAAVEAAAATLAEERS
jgi:nicotinate dehydrogenase subunit A